MLYYSSRRLSCGGSSLITVRFPSPHEYMLYCHWKNNFKDPLLQVYTLIFCGLLPPSPKIRNHMHTHVLIKYNACTSLLYNKYRIRLALTNDYRHIKYHTYRMICPYLAVTSSKRVNSSILLGILSPWKIFTYKNIIYANIKIPSLICIHNKQSKICSKTSGLLIFWGINVT